MKTKSIVTSLALGSLMTLSGCAGNNPFAAKSMDKAHSESAQEATCGAHKNGEAKCGEAKCGAEKNAEAKCGEGKCGADKNAEAKCGEGKCGGHK